MRSRIRKLLRHTWHLIVHVGTWRSDTRRSTHTRWLSVEMRLGRRWNSLRRPSLTLHKWWCTILLLLARVMTRRWRNCHTLHHSWVSRMHLLLRGSSYRRRHTVRWWNFLYFLFPFNSSLSCLVLAIDFLYHFLNESIELIHLLLISINLWNNRL